jgi:hypothetical protein
LHFFVFSPSTPALFKVHLISFPEILRELQSRLFPSVSLPDKTYRVSHDFASVFQNLIPVVFPRQNCHMRVVMILNGYGATDIRNLRLLESYVEHQGHSYVLHDMKHDYRCTSALRGSQHYSRHVTEYQNEHCPDRWIGGGGGQQNWPLRSPHLTRLDCHEEQGVWTLSKQKRGTTSNFRCCKTHEYWISIIRSSVTAENRTHVHMRFVTVLRGKVLN